MPYVYSTLSNDQEYRIYRQGPADVPQVERTVRVAGKANVMNKQFVTPLGVATSITDEEAEMLRGNELFATHSANGFVKIEASKAEDVAQAVSDLAGKDKSAQLTDANFAQATADVDGETVSVRPTRNKKA